jgi:hypothetical protein
MKPVEQNQNCSLADIEASLGMKEPLFNTFLNRQRVAKQAPYSQSSVQIHEISGVMTDEVCLVFAIDNNAALAYAFPLQFAISVYVADAEEGISISLCYWDSVLSSFGVKKASRALSQDYL